MQTVFFRLRDGDKQEQKMDGAIALLVSDVWQRDVDFPIRVPSDGLWESSDPAVLRRRNSRNEHQN